MAMTSLWFLQEMRRGRTSDISNQKLEVAIDLPNLQDLFVRDVGVAITRQYRLTKRSVDSDSDKQHNTKEK